jgi:hypothetical protein
MTQQDAAFLIKVHSFLKNVTKSYYCANNVKYYIGYRIRSVRDPSSASSDKGMFGKLAGGLKMKKRVSETTEAY